MRYVYLLMKANISLSIIFSLLFPVVCLALPVGSSIDCHTQNDSRFGYILTRTGEDTASLVSYWPTGKDAPEKALTGAYLETKEPPSLITAKLEMKQSRPWGIYGEIAINDSGTSGSLRDGEGEIFLTTVEYNEAGEIINADMNTRVMLECGGKKIKKTKHAYCAKKVLGGVECVVQEK